MSKEIRDSFVFYRSFYDGIKCLQKDDKLRLFETICEFGLNGNEPKGASDIINAVFQFVKPQIEKNNERYKNGCKGGRPKTNNKTKPK